jgi:hypothetical protein
MKRVEHLEDRFLHVLLDRDARTERTTIFVGVEDDCNQLAVRALAERTGDLTHHLDVENVKRRLRERDTRYAIIYIEVKVLIRGSHRHIQTGFTRFFRIHVNVVHIL